MKKTVLLLLLFSSIFSFSQEEKEKKHGIIFSGFVKNDVFFDTRQTVSPREGHFLLWPKPVSEDSNGDDKNATPSFNILSIQSRLSGAISGPDAFGAKTSGVIEGDFFAQADANINLFRLRHAFVKLSWEKSTLLMGQYWNPLFVTSCFPGTLSFNTGTPFQPFARNPQIRYTHTLGKIQLIAAALSQRDYASRGLTNESEPTMLRNSMLPDLHAQVHYTQEKTIAGIGIAYKSLLPKTTTTAIDTLTNPLVPQSKTIKTDDKVNGLSILAFAKITVSDITLKIENTLGENLTDVLHVSGFAATEQNAYTGATTYEPIRSNSTWVDIAYSKEAFDIGLFGGYYMKLGTKSDIVSPVYGLGNDIKSLLRISPRLLFKSGKLKLGLETEYTAGEFCSEFDADKKIIFDKKGIPSKTASADNFRILLTAIYNF